LLLEELYDDYTDSWIAVFQVALDNFRKESVRSKKDKQGKFYLKYTMLTSSSASKSASLKTRHGFFTKKMYEILKPVLKDPKRLFGVIEREILYYDYDKMCQICKTEIAWDDLEIHHVKPHQHGGKTILENGIPVHKHCHPKGKAAEDLAGELSVASA
jgi:5-methylcytosine-specific restriction endonuclease McrA